MGESAAAQERPEQPAPPAGRPGRACRETHVYVTISKQTTYVTAAFRDGYVNYVAALNQRFRSGVTPENNATVLFLKAMGPGDSTRNIAKSIPAAIGIPPLPGEGRHYVEVEKYAKASKERREGRPPRSRKKRGKASIGATDPGQ